MKKFFKCLGMPFVWLYKLFIVLVATIVAMVIFVLFPTKIVGRKNLKKVKGAVVACNHYSNFDGVLLCARLFKNTFKRDFLGKKELGKFFLFRWILGGIGCIFIDRGNIDRKAMKEVERALKRGKKIILFPEGTRNKNAESEDMQGIKSGVIFFAKRADSYIIPMRILHRSKLFRLNKIIIGEPYKVGEAGKLSTAEEVVKLEEKFSVLAGEKVVIEAEKKGEEGAEFNGASKIQEKNINETIETLKTETQNNE